MGANNDPNLLKFPQVLVVEASAGSGKTFALAKRYLKLLIDPRLGQGKIPLASILAITFTNKATFEMKERILELLKRIALDSFSSPKEKQDILELLGLSQEQAKTAARDIVEQIIRHYNFFQVQTIDSFINALLLGSALNIERSASFKIKRDYQSYLTYCLDLLIDQASSDKETLKLFEDFLDHYLFVENRKGWFPKEDILGLMHSLFTLSNKFGGLFKGYPGKSSDIIKAKKKVYSLIEELSSQLPEGMNANTRRGILKFLDKNQDIFDLAQLPQGFSKPGPLMNKGSDYSGDFSKIWQKVHKQLVSLSELDAMVAYNPYIDLFGKLLGFFQVVSKKEDLLFLEELNWKARLLFDNQGFTVAEAYYRLAAHFKHYLIDEFQDTSVLQWRNLEPMIEDALSTGGSLFYVGDKKQAIYRFRGGEVRLFDQIKAEFSRYNVIPAQLTNNWRSQKEIIEFNNQVFSNDNLKLALDCSGISDELSGDINEVIDIFRDAEQKGRPENLWGYVAVERLDEKNQQERNQIIQPKLIALINSLRQRFQAEDIALLARDNSEVELLSSWLLSEGIPVESEKTLNVIENSFIKEIICFLKFLHSPIDDLNFAGFILGEIFSRLSGSSVEEIREFIFEVNPKNRSQDSTYLYRKFSQQYPGVWQEYIQDFYQNVGFISVYELVLSIYSRFDLLKRFSGQQAFLMKFLELIKKSEDECVGMEDFFQYLENASSEDLYVNITHSSSVKVLTIHKSKGLEFPVVIIPFFKIDIKPETGTKGTNSYVCPQGMDNLGLVRITKNHRLFSKKLRAIYLDSYKKACVDELNNIYVALTRPQYELYIFIPKKSGASLNKAAFFIPEKLTESGSQRHYPGLEPDLSQPMIQIRPQTYSDWISLLKQEEANRQELINREKIIEGNLIHALLSRIGNCFKKDPKLIAQAAISGLKGFYPLVKDFSPYLEKLEEFLSRDEFKDIFYLSEGKVFCEKEVVDRYGNLKRVDRLIIKDKEAVIVDYKAAAKNEAEHRRQIKEYLQIFSAIYPEKSLKGFLVYLDDFSLEEVAL